MLSRFVVISLAGAWLAAAADVRVIEEIAVKVNGDIITRSELAEQKRETEMYLRQEQHLTGPALQAAMQEAEKEMLKEKIDELLLVQKGKDLDIKVDADVIKRLGQMQIDAQKADPKLSDQDKFQSYISEQTGMPFEDFKTKLTNSFLIHKVESEEVGRRIAIPEAELRKFYDEHKDQYIRKAQVFLAQILISTEGKTAEQALVAESKAKDIVARARKGEKFTDLVSAYSDDADTARSGGQLPPYEKGQMRADLDKIVFSNDKGYVTDPIKVDAPVHGFLILKIEERYKEGQAEFEEIKDQIQDQMAGPRMGPKLREYLTRLRAEAFLEIKDGYVDSGAAPGKDTRWHDVATLKPQTVTKEEVAARAKGAPKRLLGMVPIPGTHKKLEPDADTSQLGTPKDASPGSPQGPQTAVAASDAKPEKPGKPAKPKNVDPPMDPIKQ